MAQRKSRYTAYVAATAGAIAITIAVLPASVSDVRLNATPPPDLVGDLGGGGLAGLDQGWTELPPPPEMRTGSATAWTGDELLVWGGYLYTGLAGETPASDGWRFDPVDEKWDSMPPSPLRARTSPASAWTGREFLVWGGSDAAGKFFDDGAAYDPARETWQLLPEAPLTRRAPLSVWTGTEFLLWGTSMRVDDPPLDGAAYEPATESWRRIPSAPTALTDATAVWSGHEMIVVGARLDGGNKATTDTAVGMTFDPTANSWRMLPHVELSPQASSAAWDGRELIAWDYLNHSAAYDPAADRWRSLGRVPLSESECSPEAVALDSGVFGNYCGAFVLYDLARDEWSDISRPGLEGWGFTLVPADGAVFVLGRDVESKQQTMLVFKPES